jgi:hypothetical protein
MPKGTWTPRKEEAIDDAMNWLRNNDPNHVDRQPRGWRTLLRLHAGICLGGGPVVEDSVNWLCNELKPEDVNEPTLTALTNLAEHQCRRAH